MFFVQRSLPFSLLAIFVSLSLHYIYIATLLAFKPIPKFSKFFLNRAGFFTIRSGPKTSLPRLFLARLVMLFVSSGFDALMLATAQTCCSLLPVIR